MNTTIIKLNTDQTVLIIGGFGFLGKRIVARLETLGANVIIGTRGIGRTRQPGSNIIALHKITKVEEWLSLLDGVDVVINSAGILRQRRGETYQQVHHHSIGLLAEACTQKNIRFVHVSALGLNNNVRSRFLTSKRAGEQAIQNSNADWHIIRPSLIDGVGGYGSKWFRRVARWPVHFSPANADGRFCPVNVEDVAKGIVCVALKSSKPKKAVQRIHEFGGTEKMNVFEYLAALAPKPARLQITIPTWIARIASHLFDLFHITPYSFGHYELLKYDNYPRKNALPHLLEGALTPIVSLCSERDDKENKMSTKNMKYANPRLDHPEQSASAVIGRVRLDWIKALWVGSMLLAGTVGSYLTASLDSIILFLLFTPITLCLGHSLGMHRRFIHRSYQCPKFLEVFFVHLGTLVGIAGPLGMLKTHDLRDWAQRQSNCHSYFSHDEHWYKDVYWQLICSIDLCQPPTFHLEPKISGDKVYGWMERTWMLQQLPWAILFYVLGGWGWVCWGIASRVIVCIIGHWLIGYFAHNHGQRVWTVRGAAVQGHNIPWTSLLTMGESWHNNHHAFPYSAKLGLRSDQWDPGWWVLLGLKRIGLVSNLITPDTENLRCELHRI